MFWSHLKTMIWLRWRLSMTQMSRAGKFGRILTLLFLLALCVMVPVELLGGFALGRFWLVEKGATVHLLIWDGLMLALLMFWMIGVMTEIQRADTFDLRKLLHLPVAFKHIFLINYLASHASASLLLVPPFLFGLTIGMVSAGSWRHLLFIPLLIGWIFMLTSWTACLRNWLTRVMMNPRRRRTIIVVLTTVFILIFQVPNLYFNILRKQTKPEELIRGEMMSEPWFQWAHRTVPVLWPGHAAGQLQNNAYLPTLLIVVASFGIGWAGFHRAFRGSMKVMLHDFSTRQKAGSKVKARRQAAFMEREVPFLADDTAGIALGVVRSLQRAPEVKMAMLFPVIMIVIMGAWVLIRARGGVPEVILQLSVTGMMCFALIGLVQLTNNQFGLDRDGFGALLLSPVPRHKILLAHNLALLPFIVAMEIPLLALAVAFVGLPPLHAVACCFQVICVYFAYCLLGNALSMFAPYRFNAATMKATKMPLRNVLYNIGATFAAPFLILPAMVPPFLGMLADISGLGHGAWINGSFSLVMALGGAGGYAAFIRYQGRILQLREKDIYNVVCKEVE